MHWVYPSCSHHDWWPVVGHAEGGVAPGGHGRVSEIGRVNPRWNGMRRWACKLRLGGSNRSRYYRAGRYRGRGTGLCRENGGVLWGGIRLLWHLTDIQILDITGTKNYELVDFASRWDVFGGLSPFSPKRAHFG